MKRYVVFFILVLLFTACQQPLSDTTLESQREWVWWRGVNLASAEFAVGQNGEGALPGVYGKDYIYPNQGEVDYYKAKGMNLIRLPFRWERLQPSLYGSFNTAEFNRLKTFVNQTTAKGVNVILDPHNYARYRGGVIGSSSVPNGAFANLWSKLATEFKNNGRVFFGLMNEPFDMRSEQWLSAANAAIAAIRNVGAGNLIIVPGNGYTGAWTWDSNWYGTPNAQVMGGIKDPYNWFMYDVHQYMDSDGSGTTENCVNATIGAERLKNFTAWLRANNKKAILGEFSSGRNSVCDQALKNMVQYMEDNADVWRGWTYWAGGPWWGNNNNIEPQNGRDTRQMDILEQFLPEPQ
jgi:endoglucanase